MEKKYITDTDFLPKELTHYHGLYNSEMTDDLYQIVYGMFEPICSLDRVYETVIRIASRQKSSAIRKFKLLNWKKSLDAIHKSLNKLDSKEYEVIVFIPLRDCEVSLTAVESFFQLAIFTINELLESDTIPTPTFPNEVVPDIKELFEQSYVELFKALDEGEPDIEEYYQRAKYMQTIVLDEMYRRGIETINMKQGEKPIIPFGSLGDAEKLKDWLREMEEKPIIPSQYYDQPDLFKEIFIEKHMQLEQNSESDSVPAPGSPKTSSVYDNDTIGIRAKVMYSMLNTFCPVTDDNFNRVVALIDFAVGKQDRRYNINTTNDPKVNLENNKNSIKKYVRDCRDNPKYLEEPNSAKVRERLSMQGFEVPEVAKG